MSTRSMPVTNAKGNKGYRPKLPCHLCYKLGNPIRFKKHKLYIAHLRKVHGRV